VLLRGVLTASTRVLIKLNVHRKNLRKVLAKLPALHAPTVNRLSQRDWFSVESVIEERVVRELIPPLKAAGAEGIIEIGLNKVVP
jgi:ATP phosphoribosyltransferase